MKRQMFLGAIAGMAMFAATSCSDDKKPPATPTEVAPFWSGGMPWSIGPAG